MKPPQLTLIGVDHAARLPTPQSARVRKKRDYPSPYPWDAIVLAVDTATHSGWAIGVSGARLSSGELDTLSPDASRLISRLVKWALDLGLEKKLPVVLVLESPYGGDHRIVAALGAARERWLRGWRDAGRSKGKVVLVQPGTWRSAVLGGSAIGVKRDAIRAREQIAAQQYVPDRVVGGDEAPAILIALWAARSATVGKLIGKRARQASFEAYRNKGTQ